MTDQNSITGRSEVDSSFVKVYGPLVEKFIIEIATVNMENLPEPFIPLFGKQYGISDFKIAFVGWETRNNTGLKSFYTEAKKDPMSSLYSFFEEIDGENEYPITNYANNFGTGFWNFVFKFLAKFHNKNWKDIKGCKHRDLLESFIWGNVDSIERFEVSARDKGADYQEWKKVKDASLQFDDARHLIEALDPKIIIILSWQDDDFWIKNITGKVRVEIEPDFLDYYHLKKTNTHIYWTRHPRGMNNEKINEIITKIIFSIYKKNIFSNFPGKKVIDAVKFLNTQIRKVGDDKGLIVDELPFGGYNSGFYFKSDKWKNYMIGFEFDEEWGSSFFGGIRKVDETNVLPGDKTLAEKMKMSEKGTIFWPYWFWLDGKFKNWNDIILGEVEIESFICEVRKQLEKMLPVIDEIEKVQSH